MQATHYAILTGSNSKLPPSMLDANMQQFRSKNAGGKFGKAPMLLWSTSLSKLLPSADRSLHLCTSPVHADQLHPHSFLIHNPAARGPRTNPGIGSSLVTIVIICYNPFSLIEWALPEVHTKPRFLRGICWVPASLAILSPQKPSQIAGYEDDQPKLLVG